MMFAATKREADIQLCPREVPLAATEFQTLGTDLVLRITQIMQIREYLLANRQSYEGKEQLREEDIVEDMIGRQNHVGPHNDAPALGIVEEGYFDMRNGPCMSAGHPADRQAVVEPLWWEGWVELHIIMR
jgi:hypothetical protein